MLNFHALMAVAGATASFIDSVEEIEITFGSGSTTGTATIASVDTSRSVVFFNGWRTATNNDLTQLLCYLTLTNSTTVTATRNSSGSASTVRATVVQFSADAVDSVQYGTVSLGTSTSGTATISSVTTSRSVALYLGNIGNHTAASDRDFCDVTLTNSTTVTATRGDAFTNTATAGFVVIEFAASCVSSVQQVSITIAASNTTNTATISSVNTSRAMLFFKGNTLPDAQNAAISCVRVTLTNATTVTATRNTSHATTTCSVKCTVIEFASGTIDSIQRGENTIATSASTQDVTVTSVTTGRAIVNYCGFTSTSTGIFDEHDTFPTVSLTSATNVRLQRGNNPAGNSVTVSWEVVEFV